MASKLYNIAKRKFLKGELSWNSDTLKIMLVDAGYSFNADDADLSSAAAHELSTTGYVGGFGGSGRKTLANKSVTQDDTNDLAYGDADDVIYTAIGTPSGVTVAGILVVKEVTDDAHSIPIAFLDNTDQVLNGGGLTLQWQPGPDGLVKIT